LAFLGLVATGGHADPHLADGDWHSVLSYRIVDNGEVEGSAPPAPQTGCYVEEVFSAGEAVPVWSFGE